MKLSQTSPRASLLVAALIYCGAATQNRAHAQTEALDFTGSSNTVGHSESNAGSMGWEFTANTDLNVTALGFYNSGGTGLIEDHEVGIYDITGTLLNSTTINAGTGVLVGNFRYSDIASFDLIAGNTYIIAGTIGANASDPDTYEVSGLTAISSITLGPLGLYSSAPPASYTSLSFPTLIYNANYAYFGPNFEVSTGGSGPSGTPEPGSMGLLAGIAFAGLGVLARRRRK